VKRISVNTAFTSFLLGVTLLLLVLTVRLGPSASLVPKIVVLPLTALLLYRLARDIMGDAGAAPNERYPAAEAQVSVPTELAMMAWLLALPLLATVLGFVLGPALLVLAWLLWRARERRRVAIAAAFITAVATWLVFERLLRVHLPPGLSRALWGA
jgi:hypothetical protein